MSATQLNGRQPASEARAGMVALMLLRFTLLGVALALLGTVGNVVLKLAQG
jgi:hypothetical protein